MGTLIERFRVNDGTIHASRLEGVFRTERDEELSHAVYKANGTVILDEDKNLRVPV